MAKIYSLDKVLNAADYNRARTHEFLASSTEKSAPVVAIINKQHIRKTKLKTILRQEIKPLHQLDYCL